MAPPPIAYTWASMACSSRCRKWSCRGSTWAPIWAMTCSIRAPSPPLWEGRFLQRPAFAFSLLSRQPDNLPTAAYFARKLLEAHANLDLPPRTVLNVNVPNLPLDHIRGVQLTRLGHRARAGGAGQGGQSAWQGRLLDIGCRRCRRRRAGHRFSCGAAGLCVDHPAAAGSHLPRGFRRAGRLAGGAALMRAQEQLQRHGIGMTSQRTRERADRAAVRGKACPIRTCWK